MSSPPHDSEPLARERTQPSTEELRAHFSELERRLERIERALAGQAREAQAARKEVQAARKEVQGARKEVQAARKETQVARREGRRGPGAAIGLQNRLDALIRALYLRPEELEYPHRLTAQRFRLLSQNGEDGMTLAILREAGTGSARFVEIGCGSNGGNSGFLAQELGWSGLMIDADKDLVAAVRDRFPRDRVDVERAWVTREGINELLAEAGATGEIDLLSIDIDGNDYWIWEAIDNVSPRIVIIEANPAFGGERAVVVPYDPNFDRHRRKSIYFGASLAALAALGDRLGYRLVATEPSGPNAYFLRDDVAPQIPRAEPAALHRQMETVILKRLERDGEFGDPVAELYAYIESEELPLVDVAASHP